MSYRITLLAKFKRAAKLLIRKYPSLKTELAVLQQRLLDNPTLGTALGGSCYKIRLAIGSKGKGRSGGARVITYGCNSKLRGAFFQDGLPSPPGPAKRPPMARLAFPQRASFASQKVPA